MTETITDKLPIDNTYKKYIPILTVICCAISMSLFVGINLEEKVDDWASYKKWGYPSVTDLFGGSYWGLISTNFLHIELWHLIFNLYWFWILGKKIEFETTKIYYLLFILSAALVSSLAQLAFGTSLGMGLSGIVYAFFGFIWVKSRTAEAYKHLLNKKTINLFLGWMALGVILTHFKYWNIGNAAHIAGLLWGALLAYLQKFDARRQWAISLLCLLVLGSAIFWTPFSNSWLTYEAYQLHVNKQYDEAIAVYKKILNRDTTNEWAKENLTQLEIYQLQQKINKLIENHQYQEALPLYDKILELDKNNKWVKESKMRAF